jgi:hypothetical protein
VYSTKAERSTKLGRSHVNVHVCNSTNINCIYQLQQDYPTLLDWMDWMDLLENPSKLFTDDNVKGETLDASLEHMKDFGRIGM